LHLTAALPPLSTRHGSGDETRPLSSAPSHCVILISVPIPCNNLRRIGSLPAIRCSSNHHQSHGQRPVALQRTQAPDPADGYRHAACLCPRLCLCACACACACCRRPRRPRASTKGTLDCARSRAAPWLEQPQARPLGPAPQRQLPRPAPRPFARKDEGPFQRQRRRQGPPPRPLSA
jgi:hypothetical protein